MAKAVYMATQEEQGRRLAIVSEVSELGRVFFTSLPSDVVLSDLYSSVHNAISSTLSFHTTMMDYLKEHHASSLSWPLKTNKLSEILKGADEVVTSMENGEITPDDFSNCLSVAASHRTVLALNNETAAQLGIDSICASKFSLGTSHFNHIQTALLVSLSVLKNATTLSELQLGGIYDPTTSATIQTVGFPDGFSPSAVDGFQASIWYNDNSMVAPTLGYAFGGSRYDPIHADKVLKNEDCSSAVAKWIGYTKTPFSTWNLKNYVTESAAGNCASNPDCLNMEEMLTIKPTAEVGSVFLIGSHTGFVTQVFDETMFESLSYNRDMPYMEGLGYTNVTCSEAKPCSFFEVKAETVCESDVCEGF